MFIAAAHGSPPPRTGVRTELTRVAEQIHNSRTRKVQGGFKDEERAVDDLFRCPTCLSILAEPDTQRCPVCRQRLEKRAPIVLTSERTGQADVVPRRRRRRFGARSDAR